MFDDITGKKRSIASSSANGSVSNDDDRAESGSNKKRFVWPESLHRDFIAAVFDTGLKSATMEDIQETFVSEKGSYSAIQLKSILQKFRIYRDRKHFRRKLFYANGSNDHLDSLDGDHLSPLPIPSETRISDRLSHNELMTMMRGEVPIFAESLEIAERSCADYYADIRDRLAKVHLAIKSQQEMMDLTKQSLDEQSKIWAKANGICDSMDKSRLLSSMPPNEELDHPNHLDAWLRNYANHGANANDVASSDRTDLRIMSEMRATMNLHRKLLSQHEDQLSMHDKYHHRHHLHPHPHDALAMPATYFPHQWPVAHHPSITTSTRQYLYHSQSNVAAFPHYHVSQQSATATVKVEMTPIPPNTALDQHSPTDSALVTDEGERGDSNNNNDNNNNNGHSAKHHSGNTHTAVMPPPTRDSHHHAHGHYHHHYHHQYHHPSNPNHSHPVPMENPVPLMSHYSVSVHSQVVDSWRDLEALHYQGLPRAGSEDIHRHPHHHPHHHALHGHPLDGASTGDVSDMEGGGESGMGKTGTTVVAAAMLDSVTFDPDSFDGDTLFSFLMTS